MPRQTPLPELQPALELGIEPPALTPEVLPRKRMRGAINKSFKWLQREIRQHGPDLVETLMAEAKSGNIAALSLALQYGYGMPRKAPVQAELPNGDLRGFIQALPGRVASGEIEPEAGEHLARTAYIALRAAELRPDTPLVESVDGRELLTERLVKALQARAAANGNGHGSAVNSPDNEDYPSSEISDSRKSAEMDARIDALLERYESEGK